MADYLAFPPQNFSAEEMEHLINRPEPCEDVVNIAISVWSHQQGLQDVGPSLIIRLEPGCIGLALPQGMELQEASDLVSSVFNGFTGQMLADVGGNAWREDGPGQMQYWRPGILDMLTCGPEQFLRALRDELLPEQRARFLAAAITVATEQP